MRFIKLKLRNFKPYYAKQGEQQTINLFDEDRRDKNITINIGPTGHGKTSISEAILWCLLGSGSYSKWEEWINTLAIEIAKENNENVVSMSVELVLKLGGENYRIIRSGDYNIMNDEKDEKLSIIHDGVPLKEDPTAFITTHFFLKKLMEYFVFDADDILKKFEENQSGTIAEYINKIVGVEKLDILFNSLKEVIKLCDEDISNIQSQIKGDIADKINEKKKDKEKKEEAIKEREGKIQEKMSERNKLFAGRHPSPQVVRFNSLVNERDKLKEEINVLNKRFIDSQIISDVDLILLSYFIDDIVKKINKKPTTKEEFGSSATLIKTSLGEDFSGLFFEETEDACLIKKGVKIQKEDLGKIEELDLKSGEGTKGFAFNIFEDYKRKIDETKGLFKDYKRDFDEAKRKLLRVMNEIEQMGNTIENKEFNEKYNKFTEIEKKITQYGKDKKDIKKRIEEIEKEIDGLQTELKYDENQKKEIEKVEEKKKVTEILQKNTKETRKRFLEDLLHFVNKTASESLRSIVKDTNRFHSIEIDDNYQFKVKQENGESLEERQINKGTLQISMMCFFIGLSKFLGKKIPFIIDDPLLRLDPGHDKRLIEQLSKTHEQLILHLIPGKEYTTHSFKWLNPYINIQNWVSIEKYYRSELTSFIEQKEADRTVEFNIEEL